VKWDQEIRNNNNVNSLSREIIIHNKNNTTAKTKTTQPQKQLEQPEKFFK
jgi:hypothetical protein